MEREWLDVIDELHRMARSRFPRRRTSVRGLNDLFQADLCDLKNFSRVNGGYKYLLTVINVFSKFAWAEPLKSKGAQEVTAAMRRILEQTTPPRNLQVDRGTEFYNATFKALMQLYEINMYSTYSVLKAAVVERFNRTLKSMMFKNFTIKGNQKWVEDLPELVARYNNNVHRTIGMRPTDVGVKDEKRLLRTVHREIKRVGKARFKVGDIVRISKYKHLFEKKYTPNWGSENFVIAKRLATFPRTYLLRDGQNEDIEGSFYEAELQKTAHPGIYLVESVLKKQGNREFVKWLGMDKSHNSWIDV